MYIPNNYPLFGIDTQGNALQELYEGYQIQDRRMERFPLPVESVSLDVRLATGTFRISTNYDLSQD